MSLDFSYYEFIKSRPTGWEILFNTIFSHRQKSDKVKRRTNVIFQIIFKVVHNSRNQKLPMHHVSLCETIHDACRSKKLIEILGLCMSYNELERIDMELA